ncbi:MAG: DinB family protein [Bacteroidota bacterium]|nr:DinB family protein [Bacteroidota bacterium]
MKQYIIRLFNYSHWANELILEVLEKNKLNDEYILKMLSHILNAQYIWLARINPKFVHNVQLWDVHNMDVIKEMNETISTLYIEFVAKQKLSAFNNKYDNTNLKGEKFATALADILIHVANHNAHHRGQISLKIRELGVEPPNFNYITYARSFNIW